MASIYEQILVAVREKCKTLLPTGVDPDNVIIHKVPSDRKEYLPETLPAVIVAPVGRVTISPTEGGNSEDVIRYPVMVALIQKSATAASGSKPQDDNRDRMLQWHETVRRAFVHQRLGSVEGTPYCDNVDPGDTFNAAAFFKNHDAGGMVFKFRSQESRGTN